MSHSTGIKIEIGLDSHTIHCGSRGPAEACNVRVGEPKTFTDDEALKVLWAMPIAGAGHMALFGVLCDSALFEKDLYSDGEGWLKVTVSHFD